jgi:methionyl aminopeptidase
MRKAGALLARVMAEVRRSVRPGATTKDIDILAEKLIRGADATPAFLGYRGYPASICVSVNETVVHGIPGKRLIKDGDIVSLDLGLEYKGFFSDCALTLPVGRVSPAAAKLIETTQASLDDAIRRVRPGARVADVSHAVQARVEKEGFSVVRQFVGHGIGRRLHEEPEIPNWGTPGEGDELRAGMCLAIEPMVNQGSWECRVLDDGWTAVTADGKLSAHFEHTVAVVAGGAEVLTSL